MDIKLLTKVKYKLLMVFRRFFEVVITISLSGGVGV